MNSFVLFSVSAFYMPDPVLGDENSAVNRKAVKFLMSQTLLRNEGCDFSSRKSPLNNMWNK